MRAMTLRDLEKHQSAIVTGFSADSSDLETRLREIGFAEGDKVEIMHVGTFGRNPISVKLNGTLIAMRKREAAAVQIELEGSS